MARSLWMLAFGGGKQGSETLSTAAAVCSPHPSMSSSPTVVFHLNFLEWVKRSTEDLGLIVMTSRSCPCLPLTSPEGQTFSPLLKECGRVLLSEIHAHQLIHYGLSLSGAGFKCYKAQEGSTSLLRGAEVNVSPRPHPPEGFPGIYLTPDLLLPLIIPNFNLWLTPLLRFCFSPLAGFKFTVKPRCMHVWAVLTSAQLCLLLCGRHPNGCAA